MSDHATLLGKLSNNAPLRTEDAAWFNCNFSTIVSLFQCQPLSFSYLPFGILRKSAETMRYCRALLCVHNLVMFSAMFSADNLDNLGGELAV